LSQGILGTKILDVDAYMNTATVPNYLHKCT
jgi:hypothetical protein